MQCLPLTPVLREGWAALLQEGLLGPLWRVLPRVLGAHHQGAGHGKCPAPLTPHAWCRHVCVLTDFPTPALFGSPFRWLGTPPCLLSPLVCLCVSGTSILELASQAPKVGSGLPFQGEGEERSYGAAGAAELGCPHHPPARWPGS